MAAALLLIAGGLGIAFGSQRTSPGTVDSIVSLDVNPSIELKIDSNEKVVETSARNEDARIILDDMDLKGTDLNVAVNARAWIHVEAWLYHQGCQLHSGIR